MIGGGIGGLAAALAFARQGAVVTVFERATAFTDIGAGIQITPNGGAVLAALRLPVDDRSLRAEAVEPMGATTGRKIARFNLMARPYRFMHRADLIAILADGCRASGVNLVTGQIVTHVAASGAITFTHGRKVQADLVIGADGLHSLARPVLNGTDAPFFTGQTAWRAVIEASSAAVARIWMAPGRHVVTYPLPGGRLNIVAVREQAAWAAEGWDHAVDPATLRDGFSDLCPALRAILAQVTETRLWGLFRHPVAGVWGQGRLALLGDAAHPTLPFLAQGANLALEDAWVLADLTNRHTNLDAAFAAYQAVRVPRVTRAIAAADANARNYHLAGGRRIVAQSGLRLIGQLAPGAFLRRLDWLYGLDVTRGVG